MEWFKPQRDGTLRYFAPDGSSGPDGELCDTKLKFFLTRHRPTYRQPYGESMLSRLYWPWFFRYNGWRFWMQFLERFGMPLLLGKVNKPGDFVNALLALGIDSAIAVGKDEDLSAVHPTGGHDAFEKLDNALCKRIQKTILGQTLTTDVDSKGSYAAAKVHDLVRLDKRNADIRMISTTVQAIIDAHVALNFGEGTERPQFVMEDGTGLELERAERDAKLVQAGVCRLTENYLLRVYDFEEGDFEIPETPDPNAPGDGGEGGEKGDKGKTGRFAGSARPSRRRAFTAAQEEVERLGDAALAAVQAPISQDELRTAILQARDPEDLAERLALVMREADSAEFRRTLEQALFAADVLGYVHAAERR
jgi:phage gp29-like protein